MLLQEGGKVSSGFDAKKTSKNVEEKKSAVSDWLIAIHGGV